MDLIQRDYFSLLSFLKQILHQGLKCKLFVWKVISGLPRKKTELKQGREVSPCQVLYQQCCHCEHLGLSALRSYGRQWRTRYRGIYFPSNALKMLWNSVFQGDVVWTPTESTMSSIFCCPSSFSFQLISSNHVKESITLCMLSNIVVLRHHLPSVVFTLLNRHIIIFGFECYLILKDLLQALIFTIQNKYPQNNWTLHISYFPPWRNYIVSFKKIIQA